MQFIPYSPIAIPKAANGLVAGDKKSLTDFWSLVGEKLENGLPDAVGCYIYAIRAGKGILPWYVGMAEKQAFRKECFAPHKINHYNNAIAARKGTPVFTFVAKCTAGNKYAKPSVGGHRDVQFLETMLIASCMRRNPNLLNIKDTLLLREMIVPGLLNNPKGRNSSSVAEFRALLGM